MTRQEIFAQLYSTEEVFRPPLESSSALLEVAQGCSYGKCFFCDFTRDAYIEMSMEDIERKIKLLSLVIDGNDRLHFLGCNPFSLDTDRLLTILDMVHAYLPSVKTVSMYARADDINRKSADELLALNRAGIKELHVGLESGCDEVLRLHNKGETAAEIESALASLTACGIYYHLTAILGMGGRHLSREHMTMTAQLLSQLRPLSIWCMALKIWPNTPLERMVNTGRFEPLSPRRILLEEREMLQRMNLKHTCLYVDSTALNQYTIVAALPDHKQTALEQIDRLLELE